MSRRDHRGCRLALISASSPPSLAPVFATAAPPPKLRAACRCRASSPPARRPINVRVGPGTKYDVSWIYKVAGTPVEIIQEFDIWRKIRDVDGSEGWVHQTMLTGNRAGYVAARNQPTRKSPLRRRRRRRSGRRRLADPGFPVEDLELRSAAGAPSPPSDHPQPAAPPPMATSRKPKSGLHLRRQSRLRPGASPHGRRRSSLARAGSTGFAGGSQRRRASSAPAPTTSTCVTVHALRGLGQVLDHDRGGRDIDHPLLVLEKEMVVIRGVGVEIAARGIHRHFAQQPGRRGTGAACCRSSPATR